MSRRLVDIDGGSKPATKRARGCGELEPAEALVEVVECVDHGPGFPGWKACAPIQGSIVRICEDDPENPVMVYVEGDGASMFRVAGLRAKTKEARNLLRRAERIERKATLAVVRKEVP